MNFIPKTAIERESKETDQSILSSLPAETILQSSLYVCNASQTSGQTNVISSGDAMPAHFFRLFLYPTEAGFQGSTDTGTRCAHCNRPDNLMSFEGLPFCGPPCIKAYYRHSDRFLDFVMSNKLTFVRPAGEREIITGECYNCGKGLDEKSDMHYLPTKVDGDVFEYGPWPHCRPACVLRTAFDTPNNFTEWVRLVWLKYGGDVLPAPPRILLYLSGGFTLAEYHRVIDLRLVIHHETKDHFWSFPAPTYSSNKITGPFTVIHGNRPLDLGPSLSNGPVYRFSCLPYGPGRTLSPSLIAQMSQIQEGQSPIADPQTATYVSPEYVQVEPLSLQTQPVAMHGMPMHPIP